jgi:hypothetical protein
VRAATVAAPVVVATHASRSRHERYGSSRGSSLISKAPRPITFAECRNSPTDCLDGPQAEQSCGTPRLDTGIGRRAAVVQRPRPSRRSVAVAVPRGERS